MIFLLAAASRAALFTLGSSFLAVVAFAAGNALLFSGVCKIRYQKGPPTVRDRTCVLKTGFSCTEGIFGAKKAFWGTRRVSDARRAKKGSLLYGGDIRCKKGFLGYATHLQCAEQPPLHRMHVKVYQDFLVTSFLFCSLLRCKSFIYQGHTPTSLE